MTIPVIEIENVSKLFKIRREKALKDTLVFRKRGGESVTTFRAISDFSATLSAGTTVGLMGHNGSGKSTLLKLIGGIVEPDSGRISRRGRLAALLELGAGFHPDLSGRENVFLNAALLGIDKKTVARSFDEIVDFSGVADFIDTPVKFYSSGMYVRLAFSVAVNVDPDILLVDEVLAVGDEPFQRKCMNKILGFQDDGRTIVLVSHSATDIMNLASRTIVLEQGNMIFDGAPEAGIEVLRAGYKRRQGEWKPQEQAEGQGLSIQGVRSRQQGSGLVIEIDYLLETKTEGYGINLGVETLGGMRIITTESARVGIPLPSSAGMHTLTFSYEAIPLYTGTYQVSVGMFRGDGMSVDRIVGASEFEVLNASAGTGGVLAIIPKVKVT